MSPIKFGLPFAGRCRTLDDLITAAEGRISNEGPFRVVVASGEDRLSLQGLEIARRRGWIEPILVGHQRHITEYLTELGERKSNWKVIPEKDHSVATAKAAKLVQQSRADILMRGRLLARDFFQALFDPALGLRKSGDFWTNIVALKVPTVERLLLLSDCALIVETDLTGRLRLIERVVEFAGQLGIKDPRIALLAAVETVTPGMPVALEEAIIAKMSERGQFPKGVSIDGPLSLDLSINLKAVEKKKMESKVAGLADILIVNNIHVGNVLFKSLITLCGASSASVIAGAPFPIILTSRSESPENILNSIALAIIMAGRKSKYS
ncbi:MAG: phosphate butyryltransferase [Calditrichaeota bacterium]|nr:phosphate butyryltransferase [Calditrichota bacterium]